MSLIMPEYQILTKNLGLRLFSKCDLDRLAELNSDAEVRRFFPDGTKDREQTKAWMNERILNYKEKNLPWFVIHKLETQTFVGRAGFGLEDSDEVEVGYSLHQKFWGKGYASEVLVALLHWAKENITVNSIIAFTPKEHIASQRVMQKCGMEQYKYGIKNGMEYCFYRIDNRKSL